MVDYKTPEKVQVTKYMLNMEEKLKTEGLTENTAVNYVKRLSILNGGKFTSIKFIRDVDTIMEKLKSYAPSSQESYVSMIVSILNKYQTKSNDKARHQYTEILKDPSKYFVKRERNVKTPNQEKSWVSKEEMDKMINDVNERGQKAARKRKNVTTKDYDAIVDYFIISLYTLIPPRRCCDYATMKINNKDGNSYDTDTNEFVFRKYKTVGAYGEQRIPLKDYPEMDKVMSIYMNKRVDNDEDYLITKHDGSYLKQNNSMTRRLNRIFGNRKISATALRNMYVKDKYKDMNDEAIKDAAAMAHSIGIQQTSYIKKE